MNRFSASLAFVMGNVKINVFMSFILVIDNHIIIQIQLFNKLLLHALPDSTPLPNSHGKLIKRFVNRYLLSKFNEANVYLTEASATFTGLV